jgi:hypothetical protein
MTQPYAHILTFTHGYGVHTPNDPKAIDDKLDFNTLFLMIMGLHKRAVI